LCNRLISITLVITMNEKQIPSFITASWEKLLLGAAYLTIATAYIGTFVSSPDARSLSVGLPLTVLFLLFVLSIYLYDVFFEAFWKRLGILLFQIVIVFLLIIITGGLGFLPILYFITVPMAYLSYSFAQATGLTLLALGAIILSHSITDDLAQALAMGLSYGSGFAFFAAISLALVSQQRERERAEQLLTELESTHQQLQAYATQVKALAVAEERNRLAREIHDSLGHYLTATTMHLQAAGKLLAENPERAAASIAKAEDMARKSLTEVRRSVAALRASPLDTTTLHDAISELVEGLHDGGIATTFTIKGERRPLPIQTKMALYRAAQEGLTNVRKHANASAVKVELTYLPEQVTLSTTDNGTGQRREPEEGFGLLGLRERVAALGGIVEAGDAPGGGFRLRVTVPLGPKEPDDG